MIVTLTTDFGLADHFVGVMKGVILTKAPSAIIVDISHCIPPQNIKKACYLLREAVFHFPKGTLHIVVVDPTVGSDRKIIYLRAQGQCFLAPDNGVLSFVPRDTIEELYKIKQPDYVSEISSTFHGRDIFAPIAGELLQGTSPQKLGIPIEPEDLSQIDLPSPVKYDWGIEGEIIDVDHFGNLITNIPRFSIGPGVEIRLQNVRLGGIYRHYSEVDRGNLLALFNSSGFLEIACNGGNAAKKLQATEGARVQCALHPQGTLEKPLHEEREKKNGK